MIRSGPEHSGGTQAHRHSVADVYGYSRLMGQNEEATLSILTSYRKVIDSLIEQHRGRFVNSAGDSVLALSRRPEFHGQEGIRD